tara:strand:- start:156 stop:257 length:102 start_codon:yes stop_codon:yes gene_type:complete
MLNIIIGNGAIEGRIEVTEEHVETADFARRQSG